MCNSSNGFIRQMARYIYTPVQNKCTRTWYKMYKNLYTLSRGHNPAATTVLAVSQELIRLFCSKIDLKNKIISYFNLDHFTRQFFLSKFYRFLFFSILPGSVMVLWRFTRTDWVQNWKGYFRKAKPIWFNAARTDPLPLNLPALI